MLMHSSFVDRISLESKCHYESALNHLNNVVAREISTLLISDLNRGTLAKENRFGRKKKQIEWILEIMSYTLSLPLTEVDSIRICTSIYVSWITNFASGISDAPELIYVDWDHFFPLILSQLRNLFIPRQGFDIHLHASLCSTVLIALKSLISLKKCTPVILDEVLMFLLTILSKVFSQQPLSGVPNLGDHLGEVLSTNFFYIWISVSLKMFPTISMWCSFHDVCSHCIHNEQFLLQWANVSLFLTQKALNLCSLVNLNFVEKLSKFNFMDECFNDVDTQAVVHLWLKLFYSCGNLAVLGETMEMCRHIWPETVAYEMQVNHAADPKESSSNYSEQFLPIFKNISSVLPGSFFNSMRFLSSVVQLFIPEGDCKNINFIDWYNGAKEIGQSTFYQASRTKSKNLNIYESFDPVGCKLPSFFDDFSIELFQIKYGDSSLFDSKNCICFSDFQFFNNPSCYIESNTVLDLISEWLIGSCVSFKDIKISENIDYVIKHNYDLTCPTSMDPNFKLNLNDSFEIGRAYAFNIMLRLFTHQPDNSNISSAYKSRFYVLLCIGLLYHQHRAGFIFASIILSSIRLFCCDLQGVEVLIPHYLRAINTILTQKNISYGNRINSTAVQNAALRILNSIIPLILDISQFQTSDISQFSGVTITYETISNYTIDTLIEGIDEETNIVNVQLCLSALTVLFYDLIHCCPFIPNTIGDSFHEFATLPSPDKNSQSNLNDTNPIIAIMNKFYMNVSKQINSCLNLIASGQNFNVNLVFSLVESYYMLSIIPSQLISEKECVHIVMSLCNYIEQLAERPPLLHSRDVHSSIVHAYLCIASWINHHNWMIYNKTCLQSFLQIIELGLTGTKSKDSQSVKKETKLQKPISFRVYDSAEYLMFLLLELFPSRDNLKKYAPSTINESEFLNSNPTYFILENTAIFSCHDIPQHNHNPKCVVFVHGIMGKHLYEFEFNSALHHKPSTDFLNNNVAAYLDEFSCDTIVLKNSNMFENISKIWKPCIADEVIPDLAKILENYPNDLSKLSNHYQLQLSNSNSGVESYKQNLMYAAEHGVRKLSSEKLNSSYNPYRMLFSNFSFLNYDVPELKILKMPNRFSKIEFTDELYSDLAQLDKMSIRNNEFVYLFIINSFNKSVDEILCQKSSLNPDLLNYFLKQLGDEVQVKNHNGYLGFLKREIHDEVSFIYHSDRLNELIVLPSYSLINKCASSRRSSAIILGNDNLMTQKFISVDSFPESNISSTTKSYRNNLGNEVGVALVWAEDPTNTLSIPIKNLVAKMNVTMELSDFHPFAVIIIFPLKNDFLKIRVVNYDLLKPIENSPIHDGVVVKKYYLAKYIRNCIFSLSIKRRLEIDSYNSPHLKRKTFIQNLSKKYIADTSTPEYFSSLFNYI